MCRAWPDTNHSKQQVAWPSFLTDRQKSLMNSLSESIRVLGRLEGVIKDVPHKTLSEGESKLYVLGSSLHAQIPTRRECTLFGFLFPFSLCPLQTLVEFHHGDLSSLCPTQPLVDFLPWGSFFPLWPTQILVGFPSQRSSPGGAGPALAGLSSIISAFHGWMTWSSFEGKHTKWHLFL